jgi:hypothetical protein
MAGRDLGNFVRKRVGSVGEHDDRLQRLDYGRSTFPGDGGEDLFALLWGQRAEGAPGAGYRVRLHSNQGGRQSSLGGPRHPTDHPPRGTRQALGIGAAMLGRQQGPSKVS